MGRRGSGWLWLSISGRQEKVWAVAGLEEMTG
jgi:hypothetical protein